MAWERLRYGDPEEADLVAKTERQFVGATAKRLDPQQLGYGHSQGMFGETHAFACASAHMVVPDGRGLAVWSGL